ncbi:reverse transcriptase domain-containing protein [Bradyrhizobium sp. RT11b]|uniref:reverse transcriptase domain-containing protein n=1 Tax=Bradyrhizobium sp. RT11b TaxID=3156332 RepID=UPI0033991C53
MGKRSAVVELFLGDMGSIQREFRPSILREDQLTMETKLEQIVVKARREPNLRFTSLAHHITRDRVLENLSKIPKRSAAGVDGQTLEAARESFGGWIELMLQSIHRQGYRAPNIRRVYIPSPVRRRSAPLGFQLLPTGPSSAARLRSCPPCTSRTSCPARSGGRPKLSAHHALATLNEVIAGGMISSVLEADLKNFFGSLDHDWVLRFVEYRVGDPRLISLIRRWLKAGVLEDGAVHPSEQGTPRGGSISVLLSNLHLHYVLDLWFERVVKGRLRGEARLVRYIDFVICFQYRSDAIPVQEALRLRLGKFGLTLEPTKTKLVEFGRFAQRHAGKRGRNRPETIYFLGLTLYCMRNQKGNFKAGMRTEKSRLKRSLMSLQELMRRIRHYKISDQAGEINAVLRGHYAYYGVAGNLRNLVKVYRAVERKRSSAALLNRA